MNKLIWFSYDPFQKDAKSQAAALKTTALYAKAMSAEIQAVYFADRFRGMDSGSYLFPLFPSLESCAFSDLEETANKSWNSLVKSLKLKTIPLKIITHRDLEVPSLDSKTRALSDAAKKAKVEFIVLQTKATSGIKRLALGSFAETFLLNSSVPTLLIPPTGALLKKPKKILYSTDLSANSFLAFKKLCPILKDLNLKVALFYYIELPQGLLRTLKPSELRQIDVDKIIKQAKPELLLKAKDFTDLAKKYNLNIEFKISSDIRSISKAEAILEFSEQYKVDCIALASQSGEFTTSIIGATSRELVRAAKCPVLIYRAST